MNPRLRGEGEAPAEPQGAIVPLSRVFALRRHADSLEFIPTMPTTRPLVPGDEPLIRLMFGSPEEEI